MDIYDLSVYLKDYNSKGLYPRREDNLADELIDHIQNRHMKLYRLSESDEAQHGADWAWIIITNKGVYRFLVQAKRIKKIITRKQASQKSGTLKKNRQVDLLIKVSNDTLVPIYVLFASSISRANCEEVGNAYTNEGLFFDSAYNVRRFADYGNKSALNHMPISCLFSTFANKCHYGYETSHQAYCAVCNECTAIETCIAQEDIPCQYPFEKLLRSRFRIENFKATPLNDRLQLLMFASSVIRSNYRFIEHCLYDEVLYEEVKELITDKVIITDYAKRHGEDYLQLLMGKDFSVNYSSKLSFDYIESTVVAHAKKARVFKKIGIFGSYARGDETVKSDVDIALVYDNRKIKTVDQLERITIFLKDVITDLKKNVDFVDYNEAKKINEDFINRINGTMKWIYHFGD